MQITAAHRRAGYTHLVTYVQNHPDLGEVVKQFLTTPDAVHIHHNALADKKVAGEVVAFNIARIPS